MDEREGTNEVNGIQANGDGERYPSGMIWTTEDSSSGRSRLERAVRAVAEKDDGLTLGDPRSAAGVRQIMKMIARRDLVL